MITLPAPGWLEVYETRLTTWVCAKTNEDIGIWECRVPYLSRWDGPGEFDCRHKDHPAHVAWVLAIDQQEHYQACPHCGGDVLRCIFKPGWFTSGATGTLVMSAE